jgi:hypothetical protein
MLHFACNKNAFLGENIVSINVWRDARCKNVRITGVNRTTASRADTGAVTLMLNSTLSDDSV